MFIKQETIYMKNGQNILEALYKMDEHIEEIMTSENKVDGDKEPEIMKQFDLGLFNLVIE